MLSRTAPMTPAAQAFLALAHAYRPADYLQEPADYPVREGQQ
jgi:hypothetical protein